MGFIKADRTQRDLFGYRISDFAKTDAKSQFIINLISRLDLTRLFARYSEQGGDSYAPDMMLGLWFYAYSQGESSSRKLEEFCQYDTRYLYLSCNLKPDHTTLSRFRKAHLDLLSDYFVQLLLIAEQEGITDLKHISIDGTKLKAAASSKHSYKEDQLNRRIEALRKDIAHYMQRCAFAEQGARDEIELEILQEEKKRLEALEKKLLERRQQLQERKKTIKAEFRNNHRINIKEPDAKSMSKIDGPGYNGQLAVDCESNIIVANDVTDETHDRYQFTNMHHKTEENLPPDRDRAYTADAGYHSLDQLEYANDNNVDALIADQKPFDRSIHSRSTPVKTIQNEGRKIKRCDFTYHKDKDYYQCPVGNKLYPVSKGKKATVYRAKSCIECPIVSYCLSGKNKVKQIHRDHRERLAEEMARKLQEDGAKLRMKERATSVEPVFGNIKHNLGFRRFSLAGLIQVKGEFNLMCIAHNLNTILHLITAKRFAALAFVYQVKYNQLIRISKNVTTIFFHKLIEKIFSTHRRIYGLIY
jgi:transposase